MTKKSKALFTVYILSLVACFTIAFIDVFSFANGTGVSVKVVSPCERNPIQCSICSNSYPASPPFAVTNNPEAYYQLETAEPGDNPDDILPGLKELARVQYIACYFQSSCISAYANPVSGTTCDPVRSCVICNNPNSVCYYIIQGNPNPVPYEMKIWKPSSEDL